MKVETWKKSFFFNMVPCGQKMPLLIQGFFSAPKTRRSLWQQDWERHFSNPGAVVLEGGDRFIFRGFTSHSSPSGHCWEVGRWDDSATWPWKNTGCDTWYRYGPMVYQKNTLIDWSFMTKVRLSMLHSEFSIWSYRRSPVCEIPSHILLSALVLR